MSRKCPFFVSKMSQNVSFVIFIHILFIIILKYGSLQIRIFYVSMVLLFKGKLVRKSRIVKAIFLSNGYAETCDAFSIGLCFLLLSINIRPFQGHSITLNYSL